MVDRDFGISSSSDTSAADVPFVALAGRTGLPELLARNVFELAGRDCLAVSSLVAWEEPVSSSPPDGFASGAGTRSGVGAVLLGIDPVLAGAVSPLDLVLVAGGAGAAAGIC